MTNSANRPMHVHWIQQIDEFLALANAWDGAVVASRCDNPFLLADFIRTWWKYYAGGRTLMIGVVFEDGHIVGGIPLCMERRLCRRTLVHVGGYAANVTHCFTVKSATSSVAQILTSLRDHRTWDQLVLERVREPHPLISYVEKQLADGQCGDVSCLIADAGTNGLIDLTRGYTAVVQHLPDRLRRYVRSGKRQVERFGELRLQRVSGIAEVRTLFDEYRELSIKSFSVRERASAFSARVQTDFFRELLGLYEAQDRLDAHKFVAGSVTLGISFGYRFGRGFKWILTTFNPDLQALRPGHLLLDALIKDAAERGDPSFDMYYGGELFYKQQWCTAQIPLRRIQLSRRTLMNHSLNRIEQYVRSHQTLLGAARRMKRLAELGQGMVA